MLSTCLAKQLKNSVATLSREVNSNEHCRKMQKTLDPGRTTISRPCACTAFRATILPSQWTFRKSFCRSFPTWIAGLSHLVVQVSSQFTALFQNWKHGKVWSTSLPFGGLNMMNIERQEPALSTRWAQISASEQSLLQLTCHHQSLTNRRRSRVLHQPRNQTRSSQMRNDLSLLPGDCSTSLKEGQLPLE